MNPLDEIFVWGYGLSTIERNGTKNLENRLDLIKMIMINWSDRVENGMGG